MATVLLTYEFGAGLGHLNRLLAVAARLRGHRLVFALPDMALGLPAVRRALGEEPRVVPGVHWPAPTDPNVRKVPTDTFADVIQLFGYADPARLSERVARAGALLTETAPDLVVADFAPTTRLASAGRMPTVVVGNGYTVPPAGQLLPAMRPWEPRIGPRSRAQEGRLLAAVNDAREAASGEAVDHFADLFQGERTFACTITEFDPYGAHRADSPVWPFNVPVVPPGPAIPERRGPAVFGYFQAEHPAVPTVLEVLSALPVQSQVYIQGADPAAVAARCSNRVGVHRRPADFARVLPTCAVLVHHAGLGTAFAGLLAGAAQVVLPQGLEHAITARGVERFGAGARLPARPEPADLRARIEGLLADSRRHEAAARAALDLGARRVPDPVAPVADACLTFL